MYDTHWDMKENKLQRSCLFELFQMFLCMCLCVCQRCTRGCLVASLSKNQKKCLLLYCNSFTVSSTPLHYPITIYTLIGKMMNDDNEMTWRALQFEMCTTVKNFPMFHHLHIHMMAGILPCKVMTWPSGAICGSVSRSRTLQYVEGRMWEEKLRWQYSVVPLPAEPPCKKSRSTQIKKELVFSFTHITCQIW